MSCYGANIETPNFDRLASRSTLFESAFAVGPGTPISHAGLYTGQYPSETGVTGSNINIPEETPVLAEWLQERGFETFGITGPSKMGSDWGYGRGFNELFEPYYDIGTRPSWEYLLNVATDPMIFKDFLRTMLEGDTSYTKLKFELLEKKLSGLNKPFFALCNFVTVHLPYTPPRPYREKENSDYSPPKFFFLEQLFDRKGSVNNPAIRLDRVLNLHKADGIGKFLANSDYLNDEEIGLLQSWYRACVKFLDDELGRFLEFYENELADDTILIVTADHGEQLGEHDLWEHSHFLFDETLKVPLLMEGPKIPRGQRRQDPASLVDVFDTICGLLEITPPNETSGQALFSDNNRDAVFMEYGERNETIFRKNTAQGRYLDDEQLKALAAGRKGIRTNDHLFVIDSNGNETIYKNPGQEELETSPQKIVSTLRNELIDVLGNKFGKWPEEKPAGKNLDDRVTSNLRELGYID